MGIIAQLQHGKQLNPIIKFTWVPFREEFPQSLATLLPSNSNPTPSLIRNLPKLFRFGTLRVLEEDKIICELRFGNRAKAAAEQLRSFSASTFHQEHFARNQESREQVMQQVEQRTETGGANHDRIDSVVETLATIGSHCESVAEVAHDARNMVTALGLYCDLLEEPGVLAIPFAHYGNELRLVAAASRRLVEKLVTLGGIRQNAQLSSPLSGQDARMRTNAARIQTTLPAVLLESELAARPLSHQSTLDLSSQSPHSTGTEVPRDQTPQPTRHRERAGRWELMPSTPIENMAAELLANHNLLAALAGPSIVLTVDVVGADRGVGLTGEDLTRVLVNMIKNAAEAMPGGGRIQIELQELRATAGTVEALALTIEDSGPGIPEENLETIFLSGYTTRARGSEAPGSWPIIHRGLGLAISRSIVEAAGGRITATNRINGGARFAIELPVQHRR